jgi:hypothetical protein
MTDYYNEDDRYCFAGFNVDSSFLPRDGGGVLKVSGYTDSSYDNFESNVVAYGTIDSFPFTIDEFVTEFTNETLTVGRSYQRVGFVSEAGEFGWTVASESPGEHNVDQSFPTVCTLRRRKCLPVAINWFLGFYSRRKVHDSQEWFISLSKHVRPRIDRPPLELSRIFLRWV